MNKKFYEAPEMEELEMKLQGVIAKSPTGDEIDEPIYSEDPAPDPIIYDD